MASYACCVKGCGGTVCLSDELEARFRRTHEWFSCPFGHSQHFGGKTKEERRIDELEKELRQARRTRDMWRENYETVYETMRTCPVPECGWRSQAHSSRLWRYMIGHFVKCHAEIPVAELPALVART